MDVLFHSLAQRIQEQKLVSPDTTLIIGLSGGPDSVFLLHFLMWLREQMPLTLIAAHLDHQWRENSAADEQFCRTMCQQLNIPFISKKLSEFEHAIRYNGSKEEVARKARRAFFEQMAQENSAHAIALAHHAQDQQETFFIRLLRGASLTGLIGMKPKDGLYIRPLLQINKDEILSYLHTHNISYCIDPTNQSDAYLRNRVRNHVIPALKIADTRFDETFTKTLARLKESEEFLEQYSREIFEKISTTKEQNLHMSVDAFLQVPDALKKRVVMHWLCSQRVPFAVSESFIDEIIKFANAKKSKKHSIHSQWHIKKQDESLVLMKNF